MWRTTGLLFYCFTFVVLFCAIPSELYMLIPKYAKTLNFINILKIDNNMVMIIWPYKTPYIQDACSEALYFNVGKS